MSEPTKTERVRELLADDPDRPVASIAKEVGCDPSLVRRERSKIAGQQDRTTGQDKRAKRDPDTVLRVNVAESARDMHVNRGVRREKQDKRETRTKVVKPTYREPENHAQQKADRSTWRSLAPLLIILVVAFSVYQSSRAIVASIESVWAAGCLGAILSLGAMLFHGLGGREAGIDRFDVTAWLLTGVLVATGILWFRAQTENQNAESRGARAELAEYRQIQAEQSSRAEKLLEGTNRREGESAEQWQARIGTKVDGKIGSQSTAAHTAKQEAILRQYQQSKSGTDAARARAARAIAEAPVSALALGGLWLMMALQILVNLLEITVPRIQGLNVRAAFFAGLLGLVLGVGAFSNEQSGWLSKKVDSGSWANINPLAE